MSNVRDGSSQPQCGHTLYLWYKNSDAKIMAAPIPSMSFPGSKSSPASPSKKLTDKTLTTAPKETPANKKTFAFL
jgi:hypothetical protein